MKVGDSYLVHLWEDPIPRVVGYVELSNLFCLFSLLLVHSIFSFSPQINLAGSATIKVLERPDLLSPQTVQASLDDQLHKFMSAIQKPKFNLFALKGNSALQPTCDSSNLLTES